MNKVWEPESSTMVRTALTIGASLSFIGAVPVFLFGVILTTGVYGSRMAWLLGVVLPLLVVTALLAWIASRTAERSSAVESARHGRQLVGVSLILVAIPFVLVGMLLLVYGSFVLFHALGLMH